MMRTHKLTRRLAVTVALAALAAPAVAGAQTTKDYSKNSANGEYVTPAPDLDLRSPDARDAARNLPPAHTPASVIEVREVPSSGFDWGDAGIGAAGMLALFSIGAGSTLLLTSRRRRRGLQVTAP
jgi:hypothetical protein